MKKLTAVILCVVMMCAFLNVSADENVTVYMNGKFIEFDVPPIVTDGRTLVPMRKLFEELGAKVDWDGENNIATGYSKGIYVMLPVGRDYYNIDEIVFPADVPAQEIDGRTLIPLRIVSEAFGMNVDYDDKTKTVNLTSANKIGRYDKGDKYYFGHLENGLPGKFGEVYDATTDSLIAAGKFDSDLNRIKGAAYLDGSFNGRKYTGTVNCIMDHSVYDGGVINGLFSGYGKYTNIQGNSFEGEFKAEMKNGYGKLTFANGDVYEGEWKDDMKNGIGKYSYANGDVYEGEWQNDVKAGYGKYTWADGTVKEGYLQNNEFIN